MVPWSVEEDGERAEWSAAPTICVILIHFKSRVAQFHHFRDMKITKRSTAHNIVILQRPKRCIYVLGENSPVRSKANPLSLA